MCSKDILSCQKTAKHAASKQLNKQKGCQQDLGQSIIKFDVDTASLHTLEGEGFLFEAPVVACIGVFDGIHKGHKDLLFSAAQYARQYDQNFVIITFDKDPDEIFCAQKNKGFKKLVSNEQRIKELAFIAQAHVLLLPSTNDFFALKPNEFLELLYKVCPLSCIQVGENFHFGAKGAGNTNNMKTWAKKYHVECIVHALSTFEGDVISSTRIRHLIQNGDYLTATLLKEGWLAEVEGKIEHGRGQGAKMGVATANLTQDASTKKFEEQGVYAGIAQVDSKKYMAAINVGKAVSFKDATSEIEAHLLDFNGQLYEQNLKLYLVKFLRNQRVFDETEELITTIKKDIEQVREIFTYSFNETNI